MDIEKEIINLEKDQVMEFKKIINNLITTFYECDKLYKKDTQVLKNFFKDNDLKENLKTFEIISKYYYNNYDEIEIYLTQLETYITKWHINKVNKMAFKVFRIDNKRYFRNNNYSKYQFKGLNKLLIKRDVI